MRGVTLAEAVIIIVVTIAVGSALLSAIRTFYRGNAYVIESAVSVDSARRGLALALENIREASFADDGSYPVSAAATSSVTFYSDVDADGGIERVRILISDDTLYRVVTNASGNPPSYTGQTGATTTIIGNVRNGTSTPMFRYYDSAGVALSATSTDESEIASVVATLMIDVNPRRAPTVITLSGSATLRNLRAD